MFDQLNRRSFLQAGAVSSVLLHLADQVLATQRDTGSGLPQRPLGKSGVDVSILCLGGWHIGKAAIDDGEDQAVKLMHQAIDNGMSFFDNCWDYHDGYSEEIMGTAFQDRSEKVLLMNKV